MPSPARRRTIVIGLLLLLLALVALLLSRCQQPQGVSATRSAAAEPTAQLSPPPAAQHQNPGGERSKEVLANHKGDYVTIVAAGTEDGRSGNYSCTERSSPLEVKALVQDGPAELRYQTGQDNKVLARRPILVTMPTLTLDAPAAIVEGGDVSITWSGPGNRGDYITVVAKSLPDGCSGNNTDVSRGSPLRVQAPMGAGPGEIRYMTAQGARVIARRDITLLPAKVSLHSVDAADAGSIVEISWTGPNNRGDYLTIVPAGAPDAQVG